VIEHVFAFRETQVDSLRVEYGGTPEEAGTYFRHLPNHCMCKLDFLIQDTSP
jgi:hypothetical protein